MMRRREHSSWQVLADVMTLLFMSVTAMLCLLMISTKVATKDKDSHPKAEYLVTLTWDAKRDVDLDLWMQTPSGIIFYNNREVPNISLDRDSRGFSTNRQIVNGQIVYSANREVISIRTIVTGDFTVGVSYYAGDSNPIDADVDVEKVNPILTSVFSRNIHMDQVHDFHNVVKFHIAEDGTVIILPTPPGRLDRGFGEGFNG